MEINLNLILTDKIIVNLYEFGVLMLRLDILDNMADEIISNEHFLGDSLYEFYSSVNYKKVEEPGFSHIVKNSPTNITIEFTNTASLWILYYLSDKVEGWAIERRRLKRQFEEFLKETSYEDQQKLESIRDETLRRLKLKENQQLLKKLAIEFSENSMKIENLAIVINEIA